MMLHQTCNGAALRSLILHAFMNCNRCTAGALHNTCLKQQQLVLHTCLQSTLLLSDIWLAWLQWGIFLFFGLFCVAGTLFVYFLFPETKGIPIEEVPNIFKRHWYWKRFVLDPVDAHGKTVNETEMATSERPLETPQWVDDKETASQGLVSIWEPKSDDFAAHSSENGHTTDNGRLMNGLENSTSRSHLRDNGYQDVDLS